MTVRYTSQSQSANSYSIDVGDIRVTAIQETYAVAPEGLLTNFDPDTLRARQDESLRGAVSYISISCFLIRTEGRVVLIDGGLGGDLTPNSGRLMTELKTLGVSRDDIDTVVLTHLHADHFGGLLDPDGGLCFPRSRLMAHQLEHEFCFRREAPTGNSFILDQWTQAQRLRPHLERFEWVGDGQKVLPGVELLHLPGHTPGHSGFLIGNGADRLLMWGDIVHQPLHQLADPEVGVAFDVDPVQARATRHDLLRKAASSRCLIAGTHNDFPCFGRIRTQGNGYGFVAVPWSSEITNAPAVVRPQED